MSESQQIFRLQCFREKRVRGQIAAKNFGWLKIGSWSQRVCGSKAPISTTVLQQIWKTSAPEPLGPVPDSVPVLHFLGMTLVHMDAIWSNESPLAIGTVVLNQL